MNKFCYYTVVNLNYFQTAETQRRKAYPINKLYFSVECYINKLCFIWLLCLSI